MKQPLLKYIRIGSLVIMCLAMASVALAGIQQAGLQSGQQPTYPYYGGYGGYAGYGGYGGYTGYGGYPGYGGYGGYPYQWPTNYCMQYMPPSWQPVQVMVPGRWEYKPTWVGGYPMTLYRPVQGGWYPYNMNTGQQAPNAGFYTAPNQATSGAGTFDSQGVWQPAEK